MVLKWHSLRAIWSLSVLMLQGTPSGLLVKLEEPGRTDGPPLPAPPSKSSLNVLQFHNCSINQ